ncbi:MAG TPA: non-homologous end-joining DNA ligase [Verrucomicrobiae bacterium]|nr:non-homologous end-joining DNA ligase [Verrucomicrobiae bacterium]
MKKVVTRVNNRDIALTNLDKVFWPEENFTKSDLIDYYYSLAPYLLPHLRNRPFTLVRYPDGIKGEFFYQKECPEHAPDWVSRVPVPVDGGEKQISFVLCNDLPTLIWLANLGCVEMHAWASRVEYLESPDFAVFDLDPAPPAGFNEALEVALLIRAALAEFGLIGLPKTSGATGFHINVPIKPIHSFAEVRRAVEYVARLLVQIYPQRCTVERAVAKRTGKVYIDYLQNGRAKTMAFVYSIRPHAGAPVSTPLTWEEVERGVDPADFNIRSMQARLAAMGDLYNPLLTGTGQELSSILKLC